MNHNMAGAKPNKSLDASGFSGLVIDNSSLTWLSPAASTQPLGLPRTFVMKPQPISIVLALLILSAPLLAQRQPPFSSRYIKPATDGGLFYIQRHGGIAIDPQDGFDPRALVLSYDDTPIIDKTKYPDAPTVPGFYLSYAARFNFERVEVIGRNVYFRTRSIDGVHYQFSGVIGSERIDGIPSSRRAAFIKGVLTRLKDRRVMSLEEIKFVHAAIA
jgi:hypothetical protein